MVLGFLYIFFILILVGDLCMILFVLLDFILLLFFCGGKFIFSGMFMCGGDFIGLELVYCFLLIDGGDFFFFFW